jgi:molybdopterin/thiamine biosynthesis adenylyltransferase
MPKVHAAIARAKAINNNVKISSFSRFDENTDVDATILLDGTDNIKSKLVMAQKARKKRIPYVFCSAQASRGIVSIFVRYKFEKAFQLPKDLVVMEIPLRQSGTEHRSRLDETELSHYRSCSSILCPAASLAGSLAASQAINFLLKKPYVSAPNALFFDLDKKEIFWRGKLG